MAEGIAGITVCGEGILGREEVGVLMESSCHSRLSQHGNRGFICCDSQISIVPEGIVTRNNIIVDCAKSEMDGNNTVE